MADKDRPLLASWQYGSGRVAAFTSDAKGTWARQWVTWDSYGRFWSQVVGSVLRSQEKTQMEMKAFVEDRDLRVLVRATDTNGRPAMGFTAWGIASPVSGSDDASLQLTWKELRPGLYEGRGRLSTYGNHFCRVRLDTRGKTGVEHAMVVRPAESTELAEMGPDLPALESIAAAGGGKVNPSLQEISQAINEVSVQRLPYTTRYWPWLALAAVILWPVDVALRRFLT